MDSSGSTRRTGDELRISGAGVSAAANVGEGAGGGAGANGGAGADGGAGGDAGVAPFACGDRTDLTVLASPLSPSRESAFGDSVMGAAMVLMTNFAEAIAGSIPEASCSVVVSALGELSDVSASPRSFGLSSTSGELTTNEYAFSSRLSVRAGTAAPEPSISSPMRSKCMGLMSPTKIFL